MSGIHPTAVIEEGAQIGEGVCIEPYAIIKKNVTIHDGACIKAHVYLDGYTTVGKNTVIYPFASIGTKTQDLKYEGEITYVRIGENCEIREYVTINSSCGANSVVQVGNNCLIMAYCHVAHQCSVGNNCILSNGATLAGHVTVEDYAIIGGLTPVHQFVRVGRHAMVGGVSRVTRDIPPYTVGGGIPYKFGGINLVGLKRRGFDLQARKDIFQAFKLVYRSGLPLQDALERIEEELPHSAEARHWLDFCRSSKRGLLGLEENGPTAEKPVKESAVV